MTIRSKFDPGQSVFLVSDPEQICRQIVYIIKDLNGILYGVRYDDQIVDFYEEELTEERIVT